MRKSRQVGVDENQLGTENWLFQEVLEVAEARRRVRRQGVAKRLKKFDAPLDTGGGEEEAGENLGVE